MMRNDALNGFVVIDRPHPAMLFTSELTDRTLASIMLRAWGHYYFVQESYSRERSLTRQLTQ